MRLKGLSTTVNGRFIDLNFSGKPIIVLDGSGAVQTLYTLESLLAYDYVGLFAQNDDVFGYYYEDLEGKSILRFSDGSLMGSKQMVKADGRVPKLHCIRYMCGSIIRSFYVDEDTEYSGIDVDLTKYSNRLSMTSWYRGTGLLNNVLGYDAAIFNNGDLQFDFKELDFADVETQRGMYQLTMECFLTPDNFTHILLIPEIAIKDNKITAKFLDMLSSISNTEAVFYGKSLSLSEFKSTNEVEILSV